MIGEDQFGSELFGGSPDADISSGEPVGVHLYIKMTRTVNVYLNRILNFILEK
jgi:hypothetical protein